MSAIKTEKTKKKHKAAGARALSKELTEAAKKLRNPRIPQTPQILREATESLEAGKPVQNERKVQMSEDYRSMNQMWEEEVRYGLKLTETSVEEGGFQEYFPESLDSQFKGDKLLKAQTAMMLESSRAWLHSLDEATRAIHVGGYADYIFPVVRNYFPNQPHHQLVSVQPMTRRIGLIYFLNYIVGQTKGVHARGDRIFDARSGYAGQRDYTSEFVTGEDQGVAVAANATQSGNMTYLPVRRNSVNITFNEAVDVVVRDNGNGEFDLVSGPGGLAIVSSSISYESGAWTITFNGGGAFAGGAVTTDYSFDSEASPTLPQIDIQISSSAVHAIRRAIKSRFSMDAQHDFQVEFGRSLDATIVAGISQLMIAETSREVIHDLWLAAGPAVASFSLAVPAGAAYTRREHFADFLITLETASASIYQATQRVHGNWLVVDTAAASFLKTMAGAHFEPAPETTSQVGVQFIGTLVGKYKVWKDPHLQNEPGAAPNGNLLMGFKGPDLWDAGYVWAPYQAFYTTPSQTFEDFMVRQGYAMRYGKKLVNSNFYRRINLVP